ncbi:MAG: phosphoribosylglycinamide formyltransferase [Bacteroidetes bacterium]|nr:phosphoribosylglycinamide formyltransferase [Bacteroidota bacterium]
MKRIAIFASGNGTNAQRIAEYFSDHPGILISIILSNKKEAYVLERAKKLDISTFIFDRDEFYNTKKVLKKLKKKKIDFIVLAGFLWLIPDYILKEYTGRIVNIHPALLPKYGGKGMYGERVHKAVIESGDKETGITIHLVNERYDEGEIIFRKKVAVVEDDTPDTIAEKIHRLEYKYFPVIIEQEIDKIKQVL